MENELERLIEDRDSAENEAVRLEEEMGVIEREYPDSYEDFEEWNSLHHEVNELNNWASYLTSCIEDLAGR